MAIAPPELSVVVPTRDEAGNVEELVRRLEQTLKGIDAELIFIDDSSDETPEILAREATAKRKDGLPILVTHRPSDQQTGLGSAAVKGVKVSRGRMVAVMDADLQHPPELLRDMVEAMADRDVDIVVASRYTAGGSSTGLAGPARRLVSLVSRAAAQVLFKEARKTTDPLSGYFVCRTSALAGLEFRPIGFKVLLEILVSTPSARVADIPLRFGHRHAGRSNASLRQGWLFLRHIYTLVVQLPGAARGWKYALVGGIGLALFLLILANGKALGLGPVQAWVAAFATSLLVNWRLNQVFTFADVASPFSAGRSQLTYLPVALVGGILNLGVFLLLHDQMSVVTAGLIAATVAMSFNLVAQRRILRQPLQRRVEMLDDDASLAELRRRLRAEVHVLSADTGATALQDAFRTEVEPPLDLVRSAARGRPVVMSEAPSTVPQARHDVGVDAWLAIPLPSDAEERRVVVARREGAAFSVDELNAALRLVARQKTR